MRLEPNQPDGDGLVAVEQSMTNVIRVPGKPVRYFCAPTHREAVRWLLGFTFNC
eukprot:COSAG01_NODE_27956_length_672_cov_6.708551_2_plen_53_part_01